MSPAAAIIMKFQGKRQQASKNIFKWTGPQAIYAEGLFIVKKLKKSVRGKHGSALKNTCPFTLGECLELRS